MRTLWKKLPTSGRVALLIGAAVIAAKGV